MCTNKRLGDCKRSILRRFTLGCSYAWSVLDHRGLERGLIAAGSHGIADELSLIVLSFTRTLDPSHCLVGLRMLEHTHCSQTLHEDMRWSYLHYQSGCGQGRIGNHKPPALSLLPGFLPHGLLSVIEGVGGDANVRPPLLSRVSLGKIVHLSHDAGGERPGFE
jgi:hypothetical protein